MSTTWKEFTDRYDSYGFEVLQLFFDCKKLGLNNEEIKAFLNKAIYLDYENIEKLYNCKRKFIEN